MFTNNVNAFFFSVAVNSHVIENGFSTSVPVEKLPKARIKRVRACMRVCVRVCVCNVHHIMEYSN